MRAPGCPRARQTGPKAGPRPPHRPVLLLQTSNIPMSSHQMPQHHPPPHASASRTEAKRDPHAHVHRGGWFTLESPFLHTYLHPSLLGGIYPRNPSLVPTNSHSCRAIHSPDFTALPSASPFPGPVFGCLRCICSTISAAIFHPSAIRHLRVHSTQKMTYKRQLPPAEPPPPSSYQFLSSPQRQPRSAASFSEGLSPIPPFGGCFTPTPHRDRRLEITNLTFGCLFRSARRAELPGTIDWPRIIYGCRPEHCINRSSALPAAPRLLFTSQPGKRRNSTKIRDTTSRAWGWVGASLLREGGKDEHTHTHCCLWDQSSACLASHLQHSEGATMQAKLVPA